MKIDSLLKFMELLTKFQKIERAILVPGEERKENDEEHSFELALLAWYILSKDKLKLDSELVIKYALVHDLVEVYAGDTDVFNTDKSAHASKEEREHAAALQLQQEFPDFAELHDLIHKYEGKQDEESKFVYALDKVHPVLKVYLDGGRGWKRRAVTLEMLRHEKILKVSHSSEVANYFDELLDILEQKETAIFG